MEDMTLSTREGKIMVGQMFGWITKLFEGVPRVRMAEVQRPAVEEELTRVLETMVVAQFVHMMML
jgi:hypothetical protein